MRTGLWLSRAKNNDNIFMSADLGFVLVKNSSREFFCLNGQITTINELILWPMLIWGNLWYLEYPASYERVERIDSLEPKVVRGILISLNVREGLKWPPEQKNLDNFPVLEKSQGFAKS